MKITTEKAPLLDGVYYGLGEMGPSAIDFFLRVYLLVYYNQVAHLSPNLSGLALGLSVLWDASIDPWIGVVSDRLYRKQKTRQHMMWVGLAILCISFLCLWNPPKSLESWGLFAYLLVFSALVNSSYSIFIVPYLSLANDLKPRHKDRTRWLGWRTAFLNVGAFLGLGIPAFFLTGNIESPYEKSALCIAIVLILGTAISILMTYSQNKSKPDTDSSKSIGLNVAIKDATFLKLLFAFFILSVGLTLNSALAVYYYKNRLQLIESEMQTVLLLFLVFFTLSIPIWIILSHRFSILKLIGLGGLLLGLSNSIIYPLLPPQKLYYAIFWASAVGGLLVGVAVLLEVYLSALMRKREYDLKMSVTGIYYGLWKTGGKISRAFALLLTGPIISYSLADTSGTRLAYIFGAGVGVFFIVAAFFVFAFIKENVFEGLHHAD